MNWADEPATWKQLKYLEQLGYQRDHALTRTEAAELIGKLGGQPEKVAGRAQSAVLEALQGMAYSLRLQVEEARRVIEGAGSGQFEGSRQGLDLAVIKRCGFWVDSCRGACSTEAGAEEVLRFYRQHGCRFVAPTHQQVQSVLDALDAAMLAWDRDYPELFFRTLELNFPELVRHG
jgi:hypothetical protein